MYRFALSPSWMVRHLLVTGVVTAFVALGFWQLARHEERRAERARMEQRLAEPVVPVDELLEPTRDAVTLAGVVDRRVVARGTYLPDDEELVGFRSHEGLPGYWVITPLLTDSGRSVLVNRGWIPVGETEGESQRVGRAPAGDVELQGVLRRDPDVSAVFIELRTQRPPQPTSVPVPVVAGAASYRNNFSYAVQWFVFAAMAAGGWLVLLRQSARRRWRLDSIRSQSGGTPTAPRSPPVMPSAGTG